MKLKNIFKMKYLRYLPIFILLLGLTTSCNKDKNNPGYDYMGYQDMYYTKFYKAYSPNPIFSDSMTNQLPAEGSVARGHMPFPYPTMTIGDRAMSQALAGMEIENEVEYNDESVAKGKELFTIYCKICHGEVADGNGYLFTSGLFPAKPTSLIEPYVQNKPDGEIYYVITAGSISGLMGPHGAQVTPDERWMIINYLRSLVK